MRIPCWSPIALLAFWTAAAVGGEEPSAEALEFFETRVRPVLVDHCIHCHGPTKQWSSFRVDSREALLAGGDYGDDVIPGNPEESLLVMAIRRDPEIEDLAMPPPPEKKLDDRQIADIVEWIRQGAAFPKSATDDAKGPQRDPKHWAFQPLEYLPEPPEVKDAGWVQTPIDQFILAKLEEAGLKPAPPADKRTLIRRATFDLTGLPPTPEEVAAFVEDDRPDAFARVVDRLLASSAYGERWGRLWLDVARYADSNGLDENVAHGNAWRYRDYVVDSFNKDKPYRRFVLEQLAGDLLPAADDGERAERLIATGFLSLGPKVLAEPDKVKMEMDIIDEQLDTTGRAFLGLTIGCARCHDHKFDPISAADYYGLAGVFKSTLTMDSFKTVAQWHENPLPDAEAAARVAAHAEKVEAKNKEIEQATAAKADEAKLKALQAELAELKKNAPVVPSAMGVAEGEPQDLPIHLRGDHLKLGAVVPRRVPEVFQALEAPHFPTDHSGRLELAQWIVDDDNALTYRVLVNRVWRWRMGAGIVHTPDNFGALGALPTHPELLDWLASWFVDNETSLKDLHRLMMLSSVYQQSSDPDPATVEKDPDNHLWGRFPVRRLEAEEVRDALLAVAGELDRTAGGSLLTVANRGYFFDHTSKDATTYGSDRRSLYLPVVRNNLYDVFQLLDFPDPSVSSGDRTTTTIAPQALLMLNGDLVLRASAGLADRVLVETDDNHRLARLYDLAYTREPTADEIKTNLAFLQAAERLLEPAEPDAQARSRRAWEALCQTILAANEFSYAR